MKVLSLWQPWASLCVIINPATGEPYKTIETRSWSTKYRGPLAIHAAACRPKALEVGNWIVRSPGEEHPTWVLVERDVPMGEVLSRGRAWYDPVPLGAIVATCTLVDVVPTRRVKWQERLHGGIAWALDADLDGAHLYVSESQRPYGDFTPGRYAWLMSDVVSVDPPAPFKGGQGLTKSWEPAAA